MKDLTLIALIGGGAITLIGIAGIVFRFFPPNDGALAITGSIVFGAALIARR